VAVGIWPPEPGSAGGNFAHSDAEHAATLASFYAVFGDVMDTDTLIGCLRTNAARYAHAAD